MLAARRYGQAPKAARPELPVHMTTYLLGRHTLQVVRVDEVDVSEIFR